MMTEPQMAHVMKETKASSSTPASMTSCWSETAFQWLQRSQQRQDHLAIPRDPSAAAWSFVRRPDTGITFMDAALKRRCYGEGERMPMVEIKGSSGDGQSCGKSSTLVTLAARYVVATRPSKFEQPPASSTQTSSTTEKTKDLPQVVIFDGKYNITATRVACAVRSLLVRQTSLPHDLLQQEIYDCLARIHFLFPEDASNFSVATLESLHSKLCASSSCSSSSSGSESMDHTDHHNAHPTLCLWDGFCITSSHQTGGGREDSQQNEILRQLTRLLRDRTIFMVIALSNNSRRSATYEKLVTHRIRLERLETKSGHGYAAVVHDENQIPFSLSLGGILS